MKTKDKIIISSLFLTLIYIISISTFISNTSGQSQYNQLIDYTEFRTSVAEFDVWNGDRTTLLGTRDVQREVGQWRDPTKQYPGVDVRVTQPFFTNVDGTEVLEWEEYANKYATNPSSAISVSFENGKMYYLQKVNMGFEILGRTYTNFPENPTQNVRISPFMPLRIGNLDGFGNEYVHSVNLPGSILAEVGFDIPNYFDKNTWTSWTINHLGPVDVMALENFWSAGPSSGGFSVMSESLRNEYGNKKVIVEPRMVFEQHPMFFYDYYVVDGDDVYNIKTTSSNAVISSAHVVHSRGQRGLVPTYIPPGFETTIPIDQSESSEEQDLPEARDDDVSKDADGVVTAEAYFRPNYDTNAGMRIHEWGGVVSESMNIVTDIDTSFGGSIENFRNNAPASVNMITQMELQPRTTVYTQDYDLKYGWIQHKHYAGSYYHGVSWQSPINTYWVPYRMDIKNVWSIQRFVVEILILSEMQVNYIDAGGQPIDVATIEDFGTNTIGRLTPDLGTWEASVSKRMTNMWLDGLDFWMDFWEDYYDQFGIYGIIGAIVAIVITIAVIIVVGLIFLGPYLGPIMGPVMSLMGSMIPKRKKGNKKIIQIPTPDKFGNV